MVCYWESLELDNLQIYLELQNHSLIVDVYTVKRIESWILTNRLSELRSITLMWENLERLGT